MQFSDPGAPKCCRGCSFLTPGPQRVVGAACLGTRWAKSVVGVAIFCTRPGPGPESRDRGFGLGSGARDRVRGPGYGPQIRFGPRPWEVPNFISFPEISKYFASRVGGSRRRPRAPQAGLGCTAPGTAYKGMSFRVWAAPQLRGPAGLGITATGTAYKGMPFRVCAAPQLRGPLV